MLTQSMPAVIDALRSVLSPGELQNLTQALGNCQQPLSHRGSTNFAPGGPPQKGGVYTHSPWDPQQTSLPSSDSYGNVDIPGMQANWNNGNRYDSQFFFPTDQYFAQNQFFGGPQHYVQNHAHIEYLTNNTFRGGDGGFRNITINETINGEPIAGIPGPAGGAGRDGRDGAPGFNGFPGRDGALPRGQFLDLRYLAGADPRVDFQDEKVIQAPLRYVKAPQVRELTSVNVPTDAISGGSVLFSVAPTAFTVLTGVSFNLDTCSISETTTTIYGFSSSPDLTFSGTPASTVSVSAITGNAQPTATEPIPVGVLTNEADGPFLFAQAAEVVVCRDPVLKGVIPILARVFQE
jgi:hypothetical protein